MAQCAYEGAAGLDRPDLAKKIANGHLHCGRVGYRARAGRLVYAGFALAALVAAVECRADLLTAPTANQPFETVYFGTGREVGIGSVLEQSRSDGRDGFVELFSLVATKSESVTKEKAEEEADRSRKAKIDSGNELQDWRQPILSFAVWFVLGLICGSGVLYRRGSNYNVMPPRGKSGQASVAQAGQGCAEQETGFQNGADAAAPG